MDINVYRDNSNARIKLPERFDFNCLGDFRKAYSGLIGDAGVARIEIDCSALQFIDSSGIGLLLLLHEKIDPARQSVAITHCDPRIRKIFAIANIHRMFDITD
jgi:HptB-dependent secretion and biofilm anti anti-sigma factor